jgi:hypothetical protein
MGAELFDRYFSFVFVRNPWDRILSIYHFSKLRPEGVLYDAAMTRDLDGFVEHLVQTGLPDQIDYVSDEDGRIIVDFVGRFERIEEDFAQVCDRIGVRASLPHRNRTKHPPYVEAHSAKARDQVAELCRRDIEAFGYTFGS